MPGPLANWLSRHRHPASLVLHAIGIPLTIWAVILAGIQVADWRWDLWWRPTGLLAAGYLLQWIGHLIEGNDMGEVIPIKKVLGRPYITVAGEKETETV